MFNAPFAPNMPDINRLRNETSRNTVMIPTPPAGIAGVGDVRAAMAGMTVVGLLMSMGAAALYGAAIGGVAAHSWKGAGTGALAAAAVTGVLGGGTMLLGGATASAMGTDAEGNPVAGASSGLMVGGGLMLLAGLGASYWTYRRWARR